MSEEKIVLEYPFKDNGAEVTEVNMRRAKVKDMRIAEEKSKSSGGNYESILFANLCELSPDAMDLIDIKDYGKLQARYQSFL